MKRIALASFLLLVSLGGAFAQSSPGLVFGQVPTAAQWNSYFAAKQNTLGFTPLNKAGDVMTGKLVTTPSTTTQAGFNFPAGVAPTSPLNGDMWSTTVGLFIRINGVTVGPFASASSSAFAATSPITVSFPASVVTYAFDFSVANTWSGLQTFSAGIRPSTVAIGGATIGANALAVTGTSLFNSGVTMGAALTYGGVTLSNAVTGTGPMVLGTSPSIASPTLTGTVAGTNVIPLSVMAQIGSNGVVANCTNGTANMTAIIGASPDNVFRIAAGVCSWGAIDLSKPAAATGILQAASFPALTGDITTSAGALATTIAANAVTNAKLATMPAFSFHGNNTSGTAVPTNVTIPGLTVKASPVAGDLVMIADSAASNAWKQATVSSIASAGSVASIDGATGVFTTGNGVTTAANVIQLTGARRTLPTVQTLTASSGTYTTSANVLWIEVHMVGAGAGAGGNGTAGQTSGGNGGDTCWNTSGAACTTPVYRAGGGLGGVLPSATLGAAGSPGGIGGTITGGSGTPTYAIDGTSGQNGGMSVSAVADGSGGNGGTAPCSWGGAGGIGGVSVGSGTAQNPIAGKNYGGGGGGWLGGGGGRPGGGGGGSGACVYIIINGPAASYTFANGAAGTAGGAGTGGSAGVTGAAGRIIVIEHYGS